MTKKLRLEIARAAIDRTRMGREMCPDDLALFASTCGMSFAAVRRTPNPSFPSDPRHIEVKLAPDTSWREISWRKSIEGSNAHRDLLAVLRSEIQSDLEDFLSATDDGCANCGSPDHPTADHTAPPFAKIAEAFIAERGSIEIKDGPPGFGNVLASDDDRAAWITYHASQSTLQVLCRSCNASKGKRGDFGKKARENAAIRAIEMAEVLLADFVEALTPDIYERCLRMKRSRVADVHPEAAAAMLRLYNSIAGNRV